MGEITPKKIEGTTSIVSHDERSKSIKQVIPVVSADNVRETRTRNKRSTVSLGRSSPKVNDRNCAKKPKPDIEIIELDKEQVYQDVVDKSLDGETENQAGSNIEENAIIVQNGNNDKSEMDADGENAIIVQNGDNDKNEMDADECSTLVAATNKGYSHREDGTDVNIIPENVVNVEGGKENTIDISCENESEIYTKSVEDVVPNGIQADEILDEEIEKTINSFQESKNGDKEGTEVNTSLSDGADMGGVSPSAEEAEPSSTTDRSHGFIYQAGAKAFSLLGKLNPYNWKS